MVAKQEKPRKSPENFFGHGVTINDQARSVILHVYNCHKKLQMKSKSKGAFQKTIEAIGFPAHPRHDIYKKIIYSVGDVQSLQN